MQIYHICLMVSIQNSGSTFNGLSLVYSPLTMPLGNQHQRITEIKIK